MNKAVRNEAIIIALIEQGTISGAAKASQVSRGTVKRLVVANPTASEALMDGRIGLLSRRVQKHSKRVADAGDECQRALKSLDDARREIVVNYAELSAEEIREREAELVPRLKLFNTKLSAQRVASKALRLAKKRHTEMCGERQQ